MITSTLTLYVQFDVRICNTATRAFQVRNCENAFSSFALGSLTRTWIAGDASSSRGTKMASTRSNCHKQETQLRLSKPQVSGHALHTSSGTITYSAGKFPRHCHTAAFRRGCVSTADGTGVACMKIESGAFFFYMKRDCSVRKCSITIRTVLDERLVLYLRGSELVPHLQLLRLLGQVTHET